ARTKDVGVLPALKAINCSASGPVLRASGVNWDLRKADPYEIYHRVQFHVPVGTVGDNYDRYLVRIAEMRQSLHIVEQCVGQIPEGPIKTAAPQLVRPPAGDAYGHVEAPKGELGFYLVSDGGVAPYRCKIRSPSFINTTALRDLLVGWKLADMIVTFGSLDINMGEVDR
ncbi:MAG: dehydrogenase subunit, partial [Dehalococcoidia bacterium]|nr:dehydrogenase subunit [Dehalococcoidia bacterium]